MKFAHISDCHLGGWRQPELYHLNLMHFKIAIDRCIDQKVDFILFAGDLFDSAFPPIETLKETFEQFNRIKEEGIKCYLIAGSHDYSVSGKTFLDVLEKGGFCEVCKYENNEDKIILKPLIHKSYHIYGYPGKKSGLEVPDLKKIQIKEPYQNNFRILMLHTTLTEVKGNLPIDSIGLKELPKADYYAMGHIHVNFEEKIDEKPAVYAGPLFPNNFKELEELKSGSFYIIDVEGYTKVTKEEIKLKEIEVVRLEITNAFEGTQKILKDLGRRDLKDKIILLKLQGNLNEGKPSDIKYSEIQKFLDEKKAYSFLKNTSKLETKKQDLQIQIQASDMDKVEFALTKRFEIDNPSKFNEIIPRLFDSLSIEKQEGEKSAIFESRLISELNKIFDIELPNT